MWGAKSEKNKDKKNETEGQVKLERD